MENILTLTSRKNPTVLEAASLSADKKARDKIGLFAAEGKKLLEEALDAGLSVQAVFFTEKAEKQYADLLQKAAGAALYRVTDEVYEKLSTESAPQGLYACLKKPVKPELSDAALAAGGLILLDGVQNPANLGAIFRSAFALGFHTLVLSDDCADAYAPKTVRAAMGSLFRLTLYRERDLAGTIRSLQKNGSRVFCTQLSDKSLALGSVDFCASDSFVIGNEGHGASEAVKAACSHSLYIPMAPGAESLNAAVAASILLWEVRRQNAG